jgi:hypothetical protein
MSSNRSKEHAASSSLKQSFQNLKTSTMASAETKIKEKFEDMTPILNKSQLRNLDQHKYSASGSTMLDPIFQPYWNWLVLQMPMNLAPNLITIIGLAINVFSSTIIMIYSPNADQDVNLNSFLFVYPQA